MLHGSGPSNHPILRYWSVRSGQGRVRCAPTKQARPVSLRVHGRSTWTLPGGALRLDSYSPGRAALLRDREAPTTQCQIPSICGPDST
jgi:hypothetical protein